MSFDSTQRINDYFDSQVGTPNELYTIHLDKNEDIPDDLGGGVFVKLSTEASFDELTGNSRPDELFTERGIVIVEIIAPVGLGTADTYALERVVSLVRDAFRGKFLNPTGTQEGFIYFEDISTARSFELPSKMDGDYLVKNVFINYQKNYVVGAVAPTEIPVNVSIPIISGTLEIGELLTTTNGTWTNSPTSFTYRWLRDDVEIIGATASTYTAVLADGDAVIKSEVVATNIIGPSLAAESVGSAILGLPVNTAIPVVTGDTDEGDLLTTTNGTWTNTPTSFTYRWLRDDVAISLATSSTYTIVAADVGTTLKSEVTAINGSGTSAAAESVGTAIGASNVPQDQGYDFFYLMEGAANISAFADFGIAPSLEGYLSSVTGNIDATQTTPANQPTTDSDGPVEFDGSQFLDVPIKSPSTNLTISFSIITSSFGTKIIAGSRDTGTASEGFLVRSLNNTTVRLLTVGSTANDFVVDNYSGIKTFFTISLSGTVADIYQQGLLMDSITLSSAAVESLQNITFGARTDGSQPITGSSPAFGVRSTSTDATEALALYNFVVANS